MLSKLATFKKAPRCYKNWPVLTNSFPYLVFLSQPWYALKVQMTHAFDQRLGQTYDAALRLPQSCSRLGMLLTLARQ